MGGKTIQKWYVVWLLQCYNYGVTQIFLEPVAYLMNIDELGVNTPERVPLPSVKELMAVRLG